MTHSVLEPPETQKVNQEPAKVSVVNDEINDFSHVISTFMKVLAWGEEKAGKVALLIHQNGEAIVFEGHLERAELIYEQLKQAKLDARLL